MFPLRARVASQLKSLIGTLTVASVGERPLIMSRLEQLHRSEEPGEDAIAHIEQRAAHLDQGCRYFSVGFRDGEARIVFPAGGDLSYSHSDGHVEDKATFIANATNGKSKWLSLEYKDPKSASSALPRSCLFSRRLPLGGNGSRRSEEWSGVRGLPTSTALSSKRWKEELIHWSDGVSRVRDLNLFD